MRSDKNVSRSDMARFITGFGKPVIVAGDTNPVSETVEKLAATFSARLVFPNEILSRRDKYDITRRFGAGRPWSNRHERDALASALYARGRIRNLVERVDRKVRGYGDRDLEWYVKTMVILKRRNVRRCIDEFLKGIKPG
jgi:predicted RNase H-like nuclease (RuvC/YqgF family)